MLMFSGGYAMYHLKKDSADGRTFIWKNTLTAIVHHPTGVGLGNFAGTYGQTQALYFESGKGTEQEALVAGNPPNMPSTNTCKLPLKQVGSDGFCYWPFL